MPQYRATLFYRDERNGETSKQFSATFADFATANTALSALLVDANNATSALIFKTSLAEETFVAGAPNVSSNVFERASATVLTTADGSKKANLQFPSPVSGLFIGNSLNTGATLWTDLEDNFKAGGWTISDGENIITTERGKRIFVRSGKSFE